MLPIHMETEISPVGSTGSIYPMAFESNSDVLTPKCRKLLHRALMKHSPESLSHSELSRRKALNCGNLFALGRLPPYKCEV